MGEENLQWTLLKKRVAFYSVAQNSMNKNATDPLVFNKWVGTLKRTVLDLWWVASVVPQLLLFFVGFLFNECILH